MTQTDMKTLSTSKPHTEDRKHLCSRPAMHRRNMLCMHGHTISIIVWHFNMQSCLLLYAQVQCNSYSHACMRRHTRDTDEDTSRQTRLFIHLLLFHAAVARCRSVFPQMVKSIFGRRCLAFLWNFATTYDPFNILKLVCSVEWNFVLRASKVKREIEFMWGKKYRSQVIYTFECDTKPL